MSQMLQNFRIVFIEIWLNYVPTEMETNTMKNIQTREFM